MALDLLIFYGSYRRDRQGIRLAHYLVRSLAGRGHRVELVDAQAVGLPMLDRMLKEYAPGEAPAAMAALGARIRAADGFVFVAGEYNWGIQPGLKNLTDHYLEEWFWRPAAIASYSAGRLAGARANYVWHPTLSEMGMAVVPTILTVGQVGRALGEDGTPEGEGGTALAHAFPQFAADLEWWAAAAKAQRERQPPPY